MKKRMSEELKSMMSNLVETRTKEEFLTNYTIMFGNRAMTVKELKFFINRFNSHHMTMYYENHLRKDFSDYDWIFEIIRTEKTFRRFKTKGIENFLFNQLRACRLRGSRRYKFQELFDEMTTDRRQTKHDLIYTM